MNTTYWNETYGIKCHNVDDCSGNNAKCGGGMNWESPYGCALLYMGLPNTNFGYDADRIYYLNKARVIAALYKQSLSWVDCNDTYFYPELRLMANGNNSYFWYTNALTLKKHNCWVGTTLELGDPDIEWYTKWVEDVAHGAMDLWFANACYDAELTPVSGGTAYFTDVEMTRFRNTFTKNIYYTNMTGAHFHNNVDGTDNPSQADCSPNCPTDLNWGEALEWMPLYKFDGSSTPNVYDILLQHTSGLIAPTSPTYVQYLTGSQSYQGLAEVIKAQWDMDCVNLTLFNRDMVYDQDFIIKGSLMVAPQLISDENYTPEPYADPKIFVDGGSQDRFVVEDGVTVNMLAGVSIEFLPGFETKVGAEFSASIDPSLCLGNFNSKFFDTSIQKTSYSSQIDTTLKSRKTEIKALKEIDFIIDTLQEKVSELKIFPNPNNGNMTVNYELPINESGTFEIYDLLGKMLLSYDLISGENELSIGSSELSQGIYIYKAYTNNNLVASDKIVVIK